MAQLVMPAWNRCPWRAGLGSIQIELQSYMFYNNGIVIFQVNGSGEAVYYIQLQQTCYAGRDRIVVSGEAEREVLPRKHLSEQTL